MAEEIERCDIVEDFADLTVVAERADEATVPLEQVIANLKRDGFLEN